MRISSPFPLVPVLSFLFLSIPLGLFASRGDGIIPSAHLLIQSIDVLSNQQQPLIKLPGELENYLRYYALDFPNVRHEFWYVESQHNRLFTHILRPAFPRGTVLVLHGYDDHSGTTAPLLTELIAAGFNIYLFDLPGHGLSDGERGGIVSFADYGKAVSAVFNDMTNRLKGPWHFLGHSTGCSAALEWLWQGNSGFSRMIFVAPLIRSSYYTISKIGTFTIGNILSSVPRLYTPVPDDPELQEYVNFMEKRDPLQGQTAAMSWVKAMIEWSDSFTNRPPLLTPLLIIQGEKDDVVEWKKNMEIISNRFPNAVVELLPRQTHIMFNETLEKRRKTFSLILDGLTNEHFPPLTASH